MEEFVELTLKEARMLAELVRLSMALTKRANDNKPPRDMEQWETILKKLEN